MSVPGTAQYLGGFAVTPDGALYVTLDSSSAITGTTITATTAFNVGSSDVVLVRDAANTLALRNGTAAQAYRVYNTYTDASNYEYGGFMWSSNVLQIGSEKAGTGATRAVQFRVGGTDIVQFNTSGHLRWNTNNTFDIGGSSLSPANITAGTSVNSVGHMHAQNATAIPAGGTAGAGYRLSSTANFGVFFGSGAPSLSAAQGSIYLRSDGSSTSTRLYVNTNGTTGWTNVTTAA